MEISAAERGITTSSSILSSCSSSGRSSNCCRCCIDMTTSSATRPASRDEDDLSDGRQCVLYYTNNNARYADDRDCVPPFPMGDFDDDDDDDEEEDDDEEADNDYPEAEDYIAVDEQGIGSGGSVIKLEDTAAFVGCPADDLEQLRQSAVLPATLQDDNDVAESFFDGGSAGMSSIMFGGRRRTTSLGSLQRLVGSDGRRSVLDGCCWYGPVTVRCLGACVRSRPFLFFVYVVLSLVLLSSCVSLALVGSLVARPYVLPSVVILY